VEQFYLDDERQWLLIAEAYEKEVAMLRSLSTGQQPKCCRAPACWMRLKGMELFRTLT
jgi:hypothetical protein